MEEERGREKKRDVGERHQEIQRLRDIEKYRKTEIERSPNLLTTVTCMALAQISGRISYVSIDY